MKKILLTTIVALSLSISGYAQEKKPVNIKYYSKEVLDEIKATPEQKEKIAELVANFNASAKEINKNTSLSEEEKKEAIKKITGERAKAYWTVLTPEQSQYLKEKKKQLEQGN